jgi:hypothetical protein
LRGGGTFLGVLLLATHPFGTLPPGPAHGHRAPALNGLVLAVTPIAALFAFYWRALRVQLLRSGHVGRTRLGGRDAGRVVIAAWVAPPISSALLLLGAAITLGFLWFRDASAKTSV